MYNRYIPGSGGYARVVMEEDDRSAVYAKREERTQSQSRPQSTRQSDRHARREASRPQDKFKNPLNFLGGEDKNAGIAGILKSLHLEDLDSGDILLLLIILFVFLEGDNMELVITLGLMLLMGLGEERKEDQKE